MIDTRYIDKIDTLQNFYNSSNIYSPFTSVFLQKASRTYGLASGATRTESITLFEAIISQIQYKLKQSGVTMVTWWYVQHILLSYMLFSYQASELVTPDNYSAFVEKIKPVASFEEWQILQVLQALYKNRTDSLIQYAYNPLQVFKSGGTSGGIVNPSNVIPTGGQTTTKDNSKMFIIGAILAGGFLLMNKGKKKGRR